MSKRNNLIFKGLQIFAWIIFVGLCIEAGALIVNFVFSIFNPNVIGNLYQKLDLTEMHNRSKPTFFVMYCFILAVAILKAYLFYIVIELMSSLNLKSPFNTTVANHISKISYFTLAIGIISFIANEIAKELEKSGFDIDKLNEFWTDGEAFIFMAAVIYIIATIFSRGVEIQNENDLTV